MNNEIVHYLSTRCTWFVNCLPTML